MPLDLYDPCPCGSGRKLKFCCRELSDDMERVLKFQENKNVATSTEDSIWDRTEDPRRFWRKIVSKYDMFDAF